MPSDSTPFPSAVSRLFLLFGLCIVCGVVFSFIGISLARLATGISIGNDFLDKRGLSGAERLSFLMATAFASLGTFGLSAIALLQFSRLDILSSINLSFRPVGKWFFLAALIALLIQPSISFISEMMFTIPAPEWFKGWYSEQLAAIDRQDAFFKGLIGFENPALFLLSFIVIAIIPAFVEEIFFRGVLLVLCAQLTGSRHAGVWLSALVFAVFHQQFLHLPALAFAGVIFGYLYIWTGNLWYPILMHFINNALGVVLLALHNADPSDSLFQPNYSYPALVVVLSAVASSFLLFLFFKNRLSDSPAFTPLPVDL